MKYKKIKPDDLRSQLLFFLFRFILLFAVVTVIGATEVGSRFFRDGYMGFLNGTNGNLSSPRVVTFNPNQDSLEPRNDIRVKVMSQVMVRGKSVNVWLESVTASWHVFYLPLFIALIIILSLPKLLRNSPKRILIGLLVLFLFQFIRSKTLIWYLFAEVESAHTFHSLFWYNLLFENTSLSFLIPVSLAVIFTLNKQQLWGKLFSSNQQKLEKSASS